MHRLVHRRLAVALSTTMVVLSACGGGTGGDPEGKAVTSVTCEDGKSDCVSLKVATIQIEAQGSFREPETGEQSASWRGSGFFIDPSGIAVTNNHVVTGAGSLRVYVGGDTTTSYSARVLGASECSDVAVIKVDGGPFPYLEWYDGTVDTGLDIYVAGFPLGDPTYTLTKGIVAKAAFPMSANWSDVERAIQHDAATNPGNSGGPVVAAKDGRVIAVHYAGDKENSQQFAISAGEVQPILDDLMAETDVNSIGVNGTAIMTEQFNGVWVSAVAAGSVASKAGVLPGDVITKLEGVPLSQSGTMKEYCDVLRSHTAADAIGLEVIRFDSQEVLKGELNGKVLEASFSFAQELQSAAPAGNEGGSGGGATGGDYEAYVKIADDSGALVLEVPTAWSDVSGAAWVIDGTTIGAAVQASTNLASSDTDFNTPAVFFGASRNETLVGLGVDKVIDNVTTSLGSACTAQQRQEYADDTYVGRYQLFAQCSGGESGVVVLAAMPQDKSFIVLVLATIVTQADLKALDRIFASFNVVKPLP